MEDLLIELLEMQLRRAGFSEEQIDRALTDRRLFTEVAEWFEGTFGITDENIEDNCLYWRG